MKPNTAKLKNLFERYYFLFGVGFVSILAQVVILRELNAAFYGIELIYILSLGIWMLGTALGALMGRRSSFPKEAHIKILFILFATFLFTDIFFIRGIKKILGAVPGAFLPFTSQITGLFLALIPVSIITGLLFQWSAKIFVTKGESLAKAYSIESAGGMLGGLASTILLGIGLQNYNIALVCSIVSLLVPFYGSFENAKPKKNIWAAAFNLLVIVLFAVNNVTDRWSQSWEYPNILDSHDTPYNRTTITSAGEQICVFEDGVLSYETESTFPEEFVHLSTLFTEKTQNILVLGGGFQGIIYELLKLPVKKVEYVEINREMVEQLQKRLPNKIDQSLHNPKVRIIYADPRKYIDHAKTCDVIMVNMPEPSSAQTNRFYTKEFFLECAGKLTEKGLLVSKTQSSENIWTTSLRQRNGSIYNALKSVFDNIIVLPGAVNIFVASKKSLSISADTLINRFNARNPSTKLVTPRYINYILTNDRFSETQNILRLQTTAANSDYQPACYSYTISIWLSKFFPEMLNSNSFPSIIENMNRPITIISLFVVLVAVFIAGRKYNRLKRIILVFGCSFVSMILETILLVLYQTKNGILYQDIGVLLMMFMLGLSVGAAVIDLLVRTKKIKSTRLLGIGLVLMFALMNLGVGVIIKTDLGSGLVAISLMLLLGGFFVSGIFAFASLHKVKAQIVYVKPLYSSDLFGGSLGSMAASLFLIPVLGLSSSLILIISVILIMLLFV